METLKARRDFLRLSKSGYRWVTPAFVVQAAPDGSKTETAPRFGFTVSKKIGNAVARNRSKRRLREMVRAILTKAKPGWTYVFIARKRDGELAFDDLCRDGRWALRKLHGKWLDDTAVPDDPATKPEAEPLKKPQDHLKGDQGQGEKWANQRVSHD